MSRTLLSLCLGLALLVRGGSTAQEAAAERGKAPPTQQDFTIVNPTSKAKLWATVFSPPDAAKDKKYPAVVFVPGGVGFGSGMARTPLPRDLTRAGFVLGLFDPDGRGRSDGKEDFNGKVHQDGLHAFLKHVAELPQVQKDNIGVFSNSLGLAMAAGALGRYPDDPKVKYFIDEEGPSDRFYITKWDSPRFRIGGHSTKDEAWWAEREAVRSMKQVRCAYLRIQRELDHVHGEDKQHALDMINAATQENFGGQGKAPWTRINGDENQANRTYTKDQPPKWLPARAGGPPGGEENLKWIREMSGSSAARAADSIKYLRLVTVASELEGGGARPEVVATADRAFVVFLRPKDSSGPTFRVKILSSDLSKVIAEKVLVSPTQEFGTPTDIRVAADGKHLYAFYETVVGIESGGFLWGAKYALDDRFEKVAQVGPIAKGKFFAITQEGDELINDPISLVGPGSVFVITRLKGKSLSREAPQIHRVREFTPDLKQKLAEFDLDLSKVAGGSPRQSSAVFWRGHFYMVVPTSTEKGEFPVDLLTPSDLLMVKLDRQWKVVDSKLISSTPGDVETFVTGFQEHKGRFYVAYVQGTIQRGFVSPLKIYDGNFNLLLSETVRKAAGPREEMRPSLAVTDRHIFVAYGIGQGPPPPGALGRGREGIPGGAQPKEAEVSVFERTAGKTEDAKQVRDLRNEHTGSERMPIQFRMNVNYFPDEAEARENCRLLRRHLDLFKQAGVKASYWFTGLAAEQIEKLDPELIRLLNEAAMPIAHHGANRLPRPQPIDRVKGESWQKDVQAILDYESFGLDPGTGELDKARAGGLKRMQQMFGNRIRATGRFFQASILYVAKQFGCRAMIGLKGNTGGSTEAGWFLGMMGLPDARSVAPEMLRRAATGEFELFRSIEDSVARPTSNEVQSIAVLVHDSDFLRGPPDLRQQLWETYEKLVRWAAKHPRLQVVTFEEILSQIADDRTKTVSRVALLKAAEVVATSQTEPPEYVDLGGDYLSLADTFQAFAQALRAFAESGKLPETVETADLLGPTETHSSGLPPVMAAVALPKVKGEEVVDAARQVSAAIGDRIPSQVAVGSHKLNPAEFLFAMALTVSAIAKDGKPAPVSLHSVDLLPRSVRENRLADPLTKLQFWTFKPQRRQKTESKT